MSGLMPVCSKPPLPLQVHREHREQSSSQNTGLDELVCDIRVFGCTRSHRDPEGISHSLNKAEVRFSPLRLKREVPNTSLFSVLEVLDWTSEASGEEA